MGASTTAVSAVSAVHHAELLLYFTLLQLSIIVVAGRVGSNLAVRWGQAAAVGSAVGQGRARGHHPSDASAGQADGSQLRRWAS